jgi:peroxiredoxin
MFACCCAALLIVSGCDRTEESPSAASPASAPEPSAIPAAPASQAVAPATAAAGPAIKVHSAPLPELLGTLPKGVGVAVGGKAPDVTLKDADGKPVRLGELYARGPVLVVFYRGGWCPFCNFQVRSLTRAADDFRALGVQPVLVSVDEVEPTARTRATYTIPFPVLSDPDLVAHRAFRVVHEASPAEYEKLKGYGMDLEQHSGRKHHTIAIPSLFLVDRQGVVRWAHADRDYKVRPTIPQILAVLSKQAT